MKLCHQRLARSGPWTAAAENPVLQSRPEIGFYATGHHSLLHLPWDDNWWCAYHMNDGTAGSGETVTRRVCLDPMHFDDAGRILPINPTREGPTPQPVPEDHT